MTTIRSPLLLLLPLLLWGCTPDAREGSGAPDPAPLLVSADWLQDRLGEEGLALLHVGTDSSFAAGHIPGARPLALLRFAPEVDGLGTELPDPEDFRALLEGAGVSDHSRIVLYSATHPPQFAARLYLTLDHFGLGDRASILDGGLRGWEGEGRPLESGDPAEARGSLSPLSPRGDFLADVDFVRARLADAGARIVDARDPQFWTGAQQLQGRAQRPGRIPGARNLPFRNLVDESGHFHSSDSLRALFAAAGIQEGEPLVAYCHVGQQASLLTVAARLLGHPVHLYDGSWEEWSADPGLPAEEDDQQ